MDISDFRIFQDTLIYFKVLKDNSHRSRHFRMLERTLIYFKVF